LLGAEFAGAEDIESAATVVGFPAVIKPIAAAASMGVVRVDSLEELRQQVAATQKQLAGLYLDEHVSELL
jgi:biotin carboxylase